MYVPSQFACADPWSIVEAHPFATLVALPSGDAAHVPLVRDDDALVGHVARPSALAQQIAAGAPLLAVFTGPHAYVSPFDYDPAGSDAGRHVPTWNYVAAHVFGRATVIEGEPVRALLARLAGHFDARGWTDAGLPDAYREGLHHGIVAFRLAVERIEGKEKLGQNRTASERLAAAEALLARPSESERAVGALMRR